MARRYAGGTGDGGACSSPYNPPDTGFRYRKFLASIDGAGLLLPARGRRRCRADCLDRSFKPMAFPRRHCGKGIPNSPAGPTSISSSGSMTATSMRDRMWCMATAIPLLGNSLYWEPLRPADPVLYIESQGGYSRAEWEAVVDGLMFPPPLSHNGQQQTYAHWQHRRRRRLRVDQRAQDQDGDGGVEGEDQNSPSREVSWKRCCA